jgi:hypothetical protein
MVQGEWPRLPDAHEQRASRFRAIAAATGNHAIKLTTEGDPLAQFGEKRNPDMKKKNIGSTLDSFLREEGLYESVSAAAIKRVIIRREKSHSSPIPKMPE